MSNLTMFLFLLLAGFALGGVAQAGTADGASDPAIVAADTAVRLGVTAGYAHYQENISPRDTEAGALIGFTGSVRALWPGGFAGYALPDLYADVEYDFSAGSLGYNGNLNNKAQTAYDTHDNAYYNDVVVRLGMGRPLSGGREIIPYVAGGYQNWYRNIGGPSGYGAYYSAGLIGGGLRLDIAANRALVLSASAEGMAVVNGSVSVPYQNFNGAFGASMEERISLDADYRLNDAWHAYAGLGVTHYSYTGSKPSARGLFEPLSDTVQVSSMFGLAYGF
ncbi:MAG: hypothetical protein B7Z75_04035 [Acidocella sp. 20-57-95]|nr:MAG: hypothetical protein B7Z75_04035 [Acidocella sp. 20-57-95]HQT63900.1 hypothetical protein [Acidocella sp.]HQU05423.1 hypothetical protein [Acidocella sp.]